MNPFEFVIVIVLIVFGAGLIRQRMNHKHKADDGLPPDIEGKLGRLEELEERVRVLEKIVTAKGNSLADEIDSL